MKRKSASGDVMVHGSSGETNVASPQNAIKTLWEELPTHQRVIAKTRNNENIYGTYIKAPDILRRLQEVFGLGYDIDFSDQVLQLDNNNLLVVVRCEVGVETDNGYRTVSDYGTAKLVDNGRINDQAVKAAATDAMKRAVRWLGIGMFQYENDEPEVLRNITNTQNSKGGGKGNTRSSSPNYKDEVIELMASQPGRVVAALEVMEKLGVYNPEDADDETAFLEACEQYKASPKQLLWAFRDEETGRRFLNAKEEGKSTKQFMDELFAKR